MSVDDARGCSALKAEVKDWIATKVNPEVPRPSGIADVIISPEEFSPDNALLTGNFKVRFKAVVEHFRDDLERLYGGPLKH